MPHRMRWTAWHLTPAGWRQGKTSQDASKAAQARPVGAVLTAVSLGGSPAVNIVWRLDNAEVVDRLTTKFGQMPPRE